MACFQDLVIVDKDIRPSSCDNPVLTTLVVLKTEAVGGKSTLSAVQSGPRLHLLLPPPLPLPPSSLK